MKIQRIERRDSPYAMAMHNLYFEAFPENERKPLETLYTHQESGFADVFVILEDDDSFVGMITTLKHSSLMFVEYFAIHSKYRGLGYGSKVLDLLHEKYHDVNICLEIDVVDPAASDYEKRLRRLHFYEKNGFQQLGIIVNLFGVTFELLGTSPDIEFDEYFLLYEQIHGKSFSDKLYLVE